MFSDNLKEWFEGFPDLDRIELEESVFADIDNSMEIGKEDKFDKTHVSELGFNGSESDFDGFKPIVHGSALVEGEPGRAVKVEEDTSKPESNLNLSIEESKAEDFDGLKPIVCGSEPVRGESGCMVKVEEESKPEGNLSLPIEEVIGNVSLVDGLESGSSSSESDSECSSSSSSSSSSSDDDNDEDEEEEGEDEEEEDKEKVKGEAKNMDGADELEEGEIIGINEEVAVDGTDSDDDDEEEEEDDDEEDGTDEILSALDIELDEVDDEEEDAGALRGPIKSKNEVEVLPQVPPLDVELQPHHQMLPVGVVLSVISTKVIVEGREQHNPLNEGSILWITADRSPLGFVDEIFGPVKNPYYVVRYNSESEVPAGIHEGTSISFVPEFANHVLNEKNLHKKGYDASGENDEELSDDAEFSDDEKEAEYRRMQKMTKRAMNDQRVGNRKSNKKKNKSKNGCWKTDKNSSQQTSTGMGQNQHNFTTISASLVNHNCSSSVMGEQNFVGGSGFVPPFSVVPQSSGIITPSNGVWTNGMPVQHPQNAIFPNRISAEGMSLLSQNYQQQPIPLPTPAMPTMMPYQQQQFDPSSNTFPNLILPGGQSNLFAALASAPWMGIAGQNGTFGMGMQGQQFNSALQGISTNGPTMGGNCKLQPDGVQGNFESSQNFNMGASSSRGRKPYHRGRGRFTGGRGHQRS
ncbi:H/ACA ribonucleoprotein complex non-core subunit NAF1 [Gossypium arboreum]|uniref:H/ACA ribonucleoprotein complex non-core subunit NAF1 n=2 Tax=Gossypium arboreum TaxID=29729 RepID=A0A0B0MZV2_GOSAR|nr:H/ACA ribonucleoprotein complex non-core subunit NAF1-like [Gossypium arboreum]KAK5772561.1 hypothetical protein PVK06_048850 [Gossypium arboreum]KHG06275.1 H/ACA ribonucleoprotein complex non-core subunit NAF1 [Gossypium arboreum]